MNPVKPIQKHGERFNGVKEASWLFCGEEKFLKDEAQRAVISKLLGDEPKAFNHDICNAKEDHRNIFAALKTLSLLSEKKIVIIENVECLPDSKKGPFLECLKYPAKNIYVIMRSGQNLFSDKFLKSISDCAKTTTFKKLGERELKMWIQKSLFKYRKSITEEALEALLELKGHDNLTMLSGEVEKLAVYKGAASTITKDDVVRLIGKSAIRGVFDLVDAISFKNRDAAIVLSRDILSGTRRGIPELLGLTGWQLRRIWKAKALLVQGKKNSYIAAELKVRDFSLNKFLSQVRRFTIDELKRDFELLVEADRKIKSGYKNPEFVFEELIIRLCSG